MIIVQMYMINNKDLSTIRLRHVILTEFSWSGDPYYYLSYTWTAIQTTTGVYIKGYWRTIY